MDEMTEKEKVAFKGTHSLKSYNVRLQKDWPPDSGRSEQLMTRQMGIAFETEANWWEEETTLTLMDTQTADYVQVTLPVKDLLYQIKSLPPVKQQGSGPGQKSPVEDRVIHTLQVDHLIVEVIARYEQSQTAWEHASPDSRGSRETVAWGDWYPVMAIRIAGHEQDLVWRK